MKKIFLYLYPIKEYTEMFLFHDDNFYDKFSVERPLPILNECINKRYRDNGYQVVFALYPDKELYGINKLEEDRVIYTDVLFSEASAVDENKNIKKDFIPTYPSEMFLLQQIGPVDRLVIGGYHVFSCVKRVGEVALENGIDTLVDLDLTDLFFSNYKQKDYFEVDNYSPEKFKEYIVNLDGEKYVEFNKQLFKKNYASPVYGFYSDSEKKR